MGVLVRKQKGVYSFTGVGRLATISLIVAISSAFINTIWSVYLDSFVGSISIVGFLSGFLTFVSFISYFLFIPVVEKTDKSKLYLSSLIGFAVLYALFAVNTSFYILIVLSTISTVISTLRITSFGIIIKDKSYEKNLSRNEGLMYTFANISFVIGPLIAGFVSSKFGISMVFVLSSIFLMIAAFVFKLSNIKDLKTKKRADTKFIKNFIDFFRNKDRILAYLFSGGVGFWWILIYLFMPLFILKQGLDKVWIGYFLFAIAIPLIILQYQFSKLASKIGFKKMIKIGFLLPCVMSFLSFFMSNPFIIMILLVLASVGLAILEPVTEAYFFDILKGKADLRFYGPFNTAIDAGHLASQFLPAILLIFLPFKFIFLFFSLFMLSYFLIAFKAKNIIESKRDGKRN